MYSILDMCKIYQDDSRHFVFDNWWKPPKLNMSITDEKEVIQRLPDLAMTVDDSEMDNGSEDVEEESKNPFTNEIYDSNSTNS